MNAVYHIIGILVISKSTPIVISCMCGAHFAVVYFKNEQLLFGREAGMLGIHRRRHIYFRFKINEG
jgi:hypothetical protein